MRKERRGKKETEKSEKRRKKLDEQEHEYEQQHEHDHEHEHEQDFSAIFIMKMITIGYSLVSSYIAAVLFKS